MSRPWPERYEDAICCLKETAIELGGVNLELKQVKAERDRLRSALQDIADLQNHWQDVEIARAELKDSEHVSEKVDSAKRIGGV